MSSGFAYESLFRVACEQPAEARLDEAAIRLFGELNTTNFEFVLGSLKIAGQVANAVGMDISRLSALYGVTQRSLYGAVGHVHVPWNDVPSATLDAIREELRRYQNVYTTNYDLIIYWAMLSGGDPNDFRDFFWGPSGAFDAANAEVWGRPTVVYFLHGGVHLRRTLGGSTLKRSAVDANLLDQFQVDWDTDETPLLVSEGTAEDKLRSINRSDYLTFVYTTFAQHSGNLVVFGFGLGDQDEHLVRAMNTWGTPWNPPQIAISVRPQLGDREIRMEKARLAQRLPDADLWFFDADSHPLGEPHVRA